jgi:hypothetical protein
MTSGFTPSPLDEVARIVIAVEGNFLYDARRFVPIAFDRAQDGSVDPCLITHTSNRLTFLEQYELLYALCEDRAQRCVGDQLAVDGRAILPERYLALWRTAIRDAVSAQDLLTLHGVRIIAVLAGPLSPLKGVKCPWDPSPFATFDAFTAHCGIRMRSQPEDGFRVELDLTEPNAAHDAFYGESFLARIWKHPRVISRLELRIESTGARGQIGLFAPEESRHVVQN